MASIPSEVSWWIKKEQGPLGHLTLVKLDLCVQFNALKPVVSGQIGRNVDCKSLFQLSPKYLFGRHGQSTVTTEKKINKKLTNQTNCVCLETRVDAKSSFQNMS